MDTVTSRTAVRVAAVLAQVVGYLVALVAALAHWFFDFLIRNGLSGADSSPPREWLLPGYAVGTALVVGGVVAWRRSA